MYLIIFVGHSGTPLKYWNNFGLTLMFQFIITKGIRRDNMAILFKIFCCILSNLIVSKIWVANLRWRDGAQMALSTAGTVSAALVFPPSFPREYKRLFTAVMEGLTPLPAPGAHNTEYAGVRMHKWCSQPSQTIDLWPQLLYHEPSRPARLLQRSFAPKLNKVQNLNNPIAEVLWSW